MARWKWSLCQSVGWSSTSSRALVVTVVTFLVLLPLSCHHLLYSYYFLRSLYLDSMSEEVLRESLHRGQEALRFWTGVSASAGSAAAGFADVAHHPELLVTVVTASRGGEGRDFHYLLQVMQRLSELLRGCGQHRCAEVLVCDVEGGHGGNKDAALLEGHFRVIRRSLQERRRDGVGVVGDDGVPVNTFEKEKRDYVFCLRRAQQLVQPRHMVVLEDDALPGADFFPVVRNLLSRRFLLRSLYVKLYHPERLQRYWNPEPYRLLEWAGLGVVGASTLLLLLRLLASVSPSSSSTPSAGLFLFLAVYVMAAAELVGRHYLLEARRLSPQLYAVAPATECCTPAMLFPGNASLRAARYLDAAVCVKGDAKDMVLYRMARTVPGERAHSVEPNVITHIGAFSSIRANPPRPRLLR